MSYIDILLYLKRAYVKINSIARHNIQSAYFSHLCFFAHLTLKTSILYRSFLYFCKVSYDKIVGVYFAIHIHSLLFARLQIEVIVRIAIFVVVG